MVSTFVFDDVVLRLVSAAADTCKDFVTVMVAITVVVLLERVKVGLD